MNLHSHWHGGVDLYSGDCQLYSEETGIFSEYVPEQQSEVPKKSRLD